MCSGWALELTTAELLRTHIGNESVLFHTQTQLRFGCVILRHMLERESGDLYYALGRYNGSRGQAPYPNAVVAAQKGWQ